MNRFRRFLAEKGLLFFYFLGLIFLGAALLSLPGFYKPGALSFVDALFTAVSAVCVTGLITVNTADFTLPGQTIILLLIQFGGLGILSFAVTYLAPRVRRVSFRHRRVLKEMFVDNVEYRPRAILRSVLGFTLGIELSGALLLLPLFIREGAERPLFAALFHGISAFCNAGFSTYPDSLEGFADNYLLQIIIMGLIVLGGLGFVVLQDTMRVVLRRTRRPSLHTLIVLASSIVLWFSGAFIYCLTEGAGVLSDLSPARRFLAAFFQSVTNRTAGFNVLPMEELSPLSRLLTLPPMFIGGASGSIAGGIKVTTFAIVAAAVFSDYDERGGLAVGRRRVPTATVNRAFIFLVKAVFLLFLAFLLLVAVEGKRLAPGLSPVNLLFETVSAFATVGLSTGITPLLSPAGKIIIICTMFAGRVGLFAIAMPMFRTFPGPHTDFPREEVLIG